MTHCYAACMLLEHGALSQSDFIAITGWSSAVATVILTRLRRRGHVRHYAERGTNHYLYELA